LAALELELPLMLLVRRYLGRQVVIPAEGRSDLLLEVRAVCFPQALDNRM